MDDKEMTHEESLQVIQSMIHKAQSRVTDEGFHFLLWGILVFAACLAQFIMIKSGFGNNSGLVWIIMPLVGGPVAFFYERKKGKTTQTQTFADKVWGYLWQGFGISLLLTIIIAVLNGNSPVPAILLLVGLATYVSGRVIKYLPMILGGIVFWVACLVCLMFKPLDQLLVNAIAILLGYILPGLALWRKYKNQNAV